MKWTDYIHSVKKKGWLIYMGAGLIYNNTHIRWRGSEQGS